MKSISLCAVVAASVCSTLLISSAEAGGRRAGLGMSSSGQSMSASRDMFPNGRSPLGEPVFLVPSNSAVGKSLSGTSGGPIGGYVPPRTPLPPLTAPPSTSATASLVSSSSTAAAKSTKVIFTPPPTIVGVPASVTGTGNIAGANVADRAFSSEGGSILNTGLKSKAAFAQPQITASSAFKPTISSSSSTDHAGASTVSTATSAPTSSTVQSSSASPFNASGVAVGEGHESTDGTPWIRITPVTYSAPTTQLGTPSSPATTGTSSATGH